MLCLISGRCPDAVNVNIGPVVLSIEVMHKAWFRAMISFFSVIYCVSSWNEWLRAGALYGNLTRDEYLHFKVMSMIMCIRLYKIHILIYIYIYIYIYYVTGPAKIKHLVA